VNAVERVQRWRIKNPEKYRDLEQKRTRDRRLPEIKFLEKIGFDAKRDTVRHDEYWKVLSKDRIYRIIECTCGADNCEKLALVDDDEIQINCIKNILKLIKTGRFTKSKQCLTKKLV